jgi:hypothetical protein
MNTITHRIPVVAFGLSLSVFFVISYVQCILFGLYIGDKPLHHELFELLPGFTWINWPSFFIGLAWSIVVAWYIALVFAPLYNRFAAKSQ